MSKKIILLFLILIVFVYPVSRAFSSYDIGSPEKNLSTGASLNSCFDAYWLSTIQQQLPSNIFWDGQIDVFQRESEGFSGLVTYTVYQLTEIQYWSAEFHSIQVSDSAGNCDTLKLLVQKEAIGTAKALQWYFDNFAVYGLSEDIEDPDINVLIDGLALLYYAPEFYLIGSDRFVDISRWEPTAEVKCGEILAIDSMSRSGLINSGGLSSNFILKFCKD